MLISKLICRRSRGFKDLRIISEEQPVDKRLIMNYAKANCKVLLFHLHTIIKEHAHGIPCAVTRCQKKHIAFGHFVQTVNKYTFYTSIVNTYVRNFGVEPEFAPESLDLFPHALDDHHEHIGTNMRLGIGQDIRIGTELNEGLKYPLIAS